MKQNELRIGNYVKDKYDDFILVIDSVNSNGVGLIALHRDTEDWLSYDNIEPVLLTEKWLTDFGFVKVDDHFENEDCWIYILSDCFELEFITKAGRFNLFKPYKYVHQLQNLYFALTGTELSLRIV